MEFAFSEAQQHWYDAAVRFATEELVDPDAVERERRGEFWREGYQRCARFGVQGLPVPTEYGGRDQELTTTVAAMEGLGYGSHDTGLIFAISASLWTVTMPILAFGTESQKRRYVPGLCDGRLLGANAASEPEAGSDIFSMHTRAERVADGWLLNGRKTWITCAPTADIVVCFAATDPSKGALGISAFVVERETPGFRAAREIPNLGLRTATMGELALENCLVPADSLLGREGRGSVIFNAALEWERGAILAAVLGTMRRSSRVASNGRGPGSSSANRSASFSRSRIGSSRWPCGWKPAGTWSIVMHGPSHGARMRRSGLRWPSSTSRSVLSRTVSMRSAFSGQSATPAEEGPSAICATAWAV